MGMRSALRIAVVFLVLAAFFGLRKAVIRPARPAKPASTASSSGAGQSSPPTAFPGPASPEPAEPTSDRPLVARSCGSHTTKDAVTLSIESLLKAQNEDGSWGGQAEVVGNHTYTRTSATAIALLSLLGAGYSHLSKDEIDGVVVGARIQKAIEFLQAAPDADDMSRCTAALAMVEAYGITGSEKLKESAQEAFARVAKLQGESGSWNGDLLTSLWAAEAVASARISGIEVPPEIAMRSAPYFREEILRHGDAAAAVGVILLTRDKNDPSLDAARKLLSGLPPDPRQDNFEYWYLGSLAMFQMDGPGGEHWKAWNPKLKETVLGLQDRSGEWKGPGGATASAVRTGLGTLSLEIYYRYANVLK